MSELVCGVVRSASCTECKLYGQHIHRLRCTSSNVIEVTSHDELIIVFPSHTLPYVHNS